MLDSGIRVCQARLAKEGSDGHAIGKQAFGGSTKIGCKTNDGTVRDGRDQPRGAQPDNKPKDKPQNKTQPSITDFLAYEDLGPLPKDPPILMEASGEASSVELGTCMEMKPGENSLNSKNPQDCGEGQMNEAKRPDQNGRWFDHLMAHSNAEKQERAKEIQSLIEGCPECSVKERAAQEMTEAGMGGVADRNQLSETEKAEYDGRNGEWLKEGGAKFYSLTESEAASSGYDLNDEDGSGSSEVESLAESMSPVVGSTVRPQRLHHKCIISRTGSGGVMDSPAATLKWELGCHILRHGFDF
ncbi:hypothetical protein NDU88_003300 [Pleurodeles waltl]|uniref:Uncharacterized protein n=1 Tax=Pleurodeles waltl TaxID=8319 RepID=A0AAV7LEY2_PLEWA|nr:hypothetical protein NDU88_003300 [Pleurodeles waltl]